VTGAGLPAAFRRLLAASGGAPPDTRDDDTCYGAEAHVAALERACAVNRSACLAPHVTFDARRTLRYEFSPRDVDIVVPTIRNLTFLEKWRPHLQGYHFIFVQDGAPGVRIDIPGWVDYELYNRRDIEAALGDRAWIISSRDASIRNFGFLASQKRYVYTLDDDCTPAPLAPGGYGTVNALAQHLRNLATPATPHFFNTLYDPYRAGADFVRGYPYSRRPGVRTVISHGLWLNTPDYDAPTQLVKPDERNENHAAGVVVTVPRAQFYPMCSMNVAFDRALIGAAFMQGLMGDGQPWARYDDMFAGWASKLCADRLDVGVKSGAPYIFHEKASNPFVNLKKEYAGLFWQASHSSRRSHTRACIGGHYQVV